MAMPEKVTGEISMEPLFKSERDFNNYWRNVPDVSSISFEDSVADIEKHSYVCKSHRNEYEPENTFSKKNLKNVDLKFKSGEINLNQAQAAHIDMKVPGFTLKSFIPHPSCLSTTAMMDLFKITSTLIQGKELNHDQNKMLIEYSDKVKNEQSAYLKFASQQWIHSGPEKHTTIAPEIMNYVNKFWKLKLHRVYKYPKHYSTSVSIPLNDSDRNNVERSRLSKLSTAGHIGRRLPKYVFPHLKHFVVKAQDVYDKLNTEIDTFSNETSTLKINWPKYKQVRPGLVRIGYHPEVSQDKKAEKISYDRGVQIVMSSSAFCALVNHFGHDASWTIPVSIREIDGKNGKKKMIFLDKKLPPLSMTAVDRHKFFMKRAVEKLLLKYSNVKRTDLSNPDYVDLDYVKEEEETKVSQICQYCNLQEIINDEMESSSDDEFGSDSDDENSPNISHQQEKCICGKKQKLNKFRIEYNIWELKSLETDNILSKKAKLKDLNILIRTRYEGRGTYAFSKVGCFKISAKLEFQPEYGAEVVTLNEIIKEWSSLLIRPNTTLGRVRIDPLSGEMIQLEKKNLSDLTTECSRLYHINLYDKIKGVHTILDKLSDLFPGNYLINHDPDNQNFATILKESEKNQSFNLYFKYNLLNVEDVAPLKAPWLPLDTMIITPTFNYFKRVPCCFPASRNPIKEKKSLIGKNKLPNVAKNVKKKLPPKNKKDKKSGPKKNWTKNSPMDEND